jgi:hypothetical protein
MYEPLLTRLSADYHLVAPDYPGFGHSDAPDSKAFSYTFDHIAQVMEHFTEALSLDRYALYLQDYGGPVGFRLTIGGTTPHSRLRRPPLIGGICRRRRSTFSMAATLRFMTGPRRSRNWLEIFWDAHSVNQQGWSNNCNGFPIRIGGRHCAPYEVDGPPLT